MLFWLGMALLATIYAIAIALAVRWRIPASDIVVAHSPALCIAGLAIGWVLA